MGLNARTAIVVFLLGIMSFIIFDEILPKADAKDCNSNCHKHMEFKNGNFRIDPLNGCMYIVENGGITPRNNPSGSQICLKEYWK